MGFLTGLLKKRQEQEKPKREEDSVKFSLEYALTTARDYISSLNLPYQISYGRIECNSHYKDPISAQKLLHGRRRVSHDKIETVPGEYVVPVILKHDDGTEVKKTLFIDSQTGKLSDFTPSKEDLISEMADKKRHYIIIQLKDVQSAKRLAEQIYSDESVNCVRVINEEQKRYLDSCIVFSDSHGIVMGNEESIFFKEKNLERKVEE